jgi:hypothetical protein
MSHRFNSRSAVFRRSFIPVTLLILLVAASSASAEDAEVESAKTEEAHTENIEYLTQLLSTKLQVAREAALAYNFTDPSSILLFVVSQIFHAQLSDTFPTLFFLNPLNLEFWKLLPCERKDVAKCLWWGKPVFSLISYASAVCL